MFNIKNLKYLNQDIKKYGGASLFSDEVSIDEQEEIDLSYDIPLYSPEEYLPIINQRLTERGYNQIDNIDDLDQAFQILFPIHYAMLEGERERVRNLEVLPPVININDNNDNDEIGPPPILRRAIAHRNYVDVVHHVLKYGEESEVPTYNHLILIPLNQELNQLNQRIATESADLQGEGYPVQISIIGARRILDEIQQRKSRIRERVALASTKNAPTQQFNSLPEAEVLTGNDTNQLIGEFLGGNSDNLFYKQKYVKYKAKYLELARLLNK